MSDADEHSIPQTTFAATFHQTFQADLAGKISAPHCAS
jgi:hypothetical protein